MRLVDMAIEIKNYRDSDMASVLAIASFGPIPLDLPITSLLGMRKFVALCDGKVIGFGAIDVQISCTACAYATVVALCAKNNDAASALRLYLEAYAKNCGATVIRNRL